jgi:hypothetical protein
MVCHNTSWDKAHHAKECSILKKIGLKLVKCTLTDTNTASCISSNVPLAALAPQLTLDPASALPPGDNGGSGMALAEFTVATKPESYDSGDNFEYKGKNEGRVYVPTNKSNSSSYLCSPIPSQSCLQVSFDSSSSLWNAITLLLIIQLSRLDLCL